MDALIAEYRPAIAPRDYGKGRRCTMGERCKTREQLAYFGQDEVGKVGRFTEPHQVNEDGSPKVLLCEACERDRIAQSAYAAKVISASDYQGVRPKGRVYNYPLPNLGRYRKAAGLSQRDLAEDVDCTTQTIKNLEGGKMLASSKMVGKIAGALGVEIRALRGGS